MLAFDRLSNYKEEWVFEEFGNYGTPILKKGIIFAAYLDKGEIFSKAVDVIGNQPKNIIFIDDKHENL